MEFFFNPVTGRVEQRQVNNNLPFRSMTELASEINQFPFLPPSPTVPLDAFKNTVAPMAVNKRLRNTDFARSSTGAEYFQKRRDRKAREDAAARGAAKQKAITQREAAPGFSG